MKDIHGNRALFGPAIQGPISSVHPAKANRSTPKNQYENLPIKRNIYTYIYKLYNAFLLYCVCV